MVPFSAREGSRRGPSRGHVRNDVSCGAAEIGKSIDAKDVCHLLTALKDWVTWPPREAPSDHADDWQRVRAASVSRGVWSSSHTTSCSRTKRAQDASAELRQLLQQEMTEARAP